MKNSKESSEINEIIDNFNELFKDDWITKLDWSEGKQGDSYIIGKENINKFKSVVFINVSTALLKGSYLYKSFKRIDEIFSLLDDEKEVDGPIEERNNLKKEFIQMTKETYDILSLLKSHLRTIKDKYDLIDNNFTVDMFSCKTKKICPLYRLLWNLIEICFNEFKFSYNERDIKYLITARIDLLENKTKHPFCDNEEWKTTIDALILKVTFILAKLSNLNDNGKIVYSADFKSTSIDPNFIDLKDFDFNIRFKYFLNPEEIPIKLIRKWQGDCYREKIHIWQLILLMRYYTKVSKSRDQVNNLIKQYEDVHKYHLIKRKTAFDKYSLCTIKNFMYNCRFSFVLKEKKTTYEEVVKYYDEIKQIQCETLIKNFYPHKKFLEYGIKHIRESLKNENDYETIKKEYANLKDAKKNFEEAFLWCKNHQYYPFQLIWGDCLFKIKDLNKNIFFPSSFCQPIKYDELTDWSSNCNINFMGIENEIRLYEGRQDIFNLKKEIEKNKRTYVEVLGIFTAIITFLLSCISIFMDKGEVTLYDRIESVMCLGAILFLFMNIILFFTKEMKSNLERGYLIISSLVFIIILAHHLLIPLPA